MHLCLSLRRCATYKAGMLGLGYPLTHVWHHEYSMWWCVPFFLSVFRPSFLCFFSISFVFVLFFSLFLFVLSFFLTFPRFFFLFISFRSYPFCFRSFFLCSFVPLFVLLGGSKKKNMLILKQVLNFLYDWIRRLASKHRDRCTWGCSVKYIYSTIYIIIYSLF